MCVLTVSQDDALNSEEEEKDGQGCKPAGHDYRWKIMKNNVKNFLKKSSMLLRRKSEKRESRNKK